MKKTMSSTQSFCSIRLFVGKRAKRILFPFVCLCLKRNSSKTNTTERTSNHMLRTTFIIDIWFLSSLLRSLFFSRRETIINRIFLFINVRCWCLERINQNCSDGSFSLLFKSSQCCPWMVFSSPQTTSCHSVYFHSTKFNGINSSVNKSISLKHQSINWKGILTKNKNRKNKKQLLLDWFNCPSKL